MYFWYSEKGTQNKPTMLASKFSDPKMDKDVNKILEDEGFKLAAQGSMTIPMGEGVLVLRPKGKAPATLEKGVLAAVKSVKGSAFVERVSVGSDGDGAPDKPAATAATAQQGTSTSTTTAAQQGTQQSTVTTKGSPTAGKEAQEREAATKLQAATARMLKTMDYGSRQAPDEGVRILQGVDQQLRGFDAAFSKIFPGSTLRPAKDIEQVLEMIPKKVAELKQAASQEVVAQCKGWLALAAGELKKPSPPTAPDKVKERANLLLEHISEVEEGVKRARAMLQRLGDGSQDATLKKIEASAKEWRVEWEGLAPKRTANAELKPVPQDSSRPAPSGVKDAKKWKAACDEVEKDIKAGKKPDANQVEAMTAGAEEALKSNGRNWEKDLKEQFKCDWNTVKGHYKKLQKDGAEAAKEFMSGYWWFRKVTVDRAMKKLADTYKFEWESVGSTNLESDYDISVKSHGTKAGDPDPYWDWKIVNEFNKSISARFNGVQAGTLFDTNLYAEAPAPKGKKEEEKSEGEKDMDAMMEAGQDVGALMKMRRYMDWEEYNDYQEEVVKGLRKAIEAAAKDDKKKALLEARLKIASHQFDEAEGLYFLSLKKTLEKAKVPIPDKVAADTIEGQKALIALVEKLEEDPDKLMAATNEAYVEAMDQVREVEKAIKKEDAKGANADAEKRSALLAKLKTLQTDSVYFAAEAYHSAGPLKHVVQGLQKGDNELLKNMPMMEFMQSFNEQLGDFLKDLRHYEHKSPFPGLGFYRSSKYLERLCDAMGHIALKLDGAKSEVAEDFKKIRVNGQTAEQIKKALKPLVDIRGGKADFGGVEADKQQQEAEAFATAEVQKVFGSDVKTLRDLGKKIKAVGVEVNSLLRRADAGQKMTAKDERPYFK
jgi:hypothetical protein